MDFNVKLKQFFNLLAVEVSTLNPGIEHYPMEGKFVSCEYNIEELDNGVWEGGGPGNRRKRQLRVKYVIQLKNSKLGFETK